MDWPSNNPDPNAIENLIKTNVEKDRGGLERFIKEEWEKIPEVFLINLVDSMRAHCEFVIKRNGERILRHCASHCFRNKKRESWGKDLRIYLQHDQ